MICHCTTESGGTPSGSNRTVRPGRDSRGCCCRASCSYTGNISPPGPGSSLGHVTEYKARSISLSPSDWTVRPGRDSRGCCCRASCSYTGSISPPGPGSSLQNKRRKRQRSLSSVYFLFISHSLSVALFVFNSFSISIFLTLTHSPSIIIFRRVWTARIAS